MAGGRSKETPDVSSVPATLLGRLALDTRLRAHDLLQEGFEALGLASESLLEELLYGSLDIVSTRGTANTSA